MLSYLITRHSKAFWQSVSNGEFFRYMHFAVRAEWPASLWGGYAKYNNYHYFPFDSSILSKKGPLGLFYYWFSQNNGVEKVMFSSLYTLPFNRFHLNWAHLTHSISVSTSYKPKALMTDFPPVITLYHLHILRWFFCFNLHLKLPPS